MNGGLDSKKIKEKIKENRLSKNYGKFNIFNYKIIRMINKESNQIYSRNKNFEYYSQIKKC